MNKETKILIILSLILATVTSIAVFMYNSGKTSSSTAGTGYGLTLRDEFVRSDSAVLGPKNAAVTLIEFLDPECESCRAFFPIIKRILQEYEGRIQFVVRYMPFHTSSVLAIAATESAGLQGKYWEMQELLFATADEWGHQPAPRKDLFIKYATALGLDLPQFTADIEDPKWAQKAQRDMEDGKSLGVKGTPTVFVNGDLISDLSYQSLKKSIDVYFRNSGNK